LLRRRSNEGGSDKYKIIDIGGSDLALDELIEKYYFNSKHLTSCSVILTKSYNNTIKYYSIDTQTKDKEENEDKEQDPYNSANNTNGEFIKCSTDIASTSNHSIYPFTIEEIEEFFVSDSGQQKEHSLEESVCRPLIGKQSEKPFFIIAR
jgi:hypothetical protein